MSTIKKKKLDELVGGDIFAGGNDRNAVSNKEIETGPVDKSFNDKSGYKKGRSTTTDKAASHYRQDIPWFAVYSFGGTRASGSQTMNTVAENKNVVTKKTVEEKIEDLVKKSKNNDVTDKNYNPKIEKLMDTINDVDLTEKQMEELLKAIEKKKNNPNKTKNL